jgi:hypothetical protein
MTRNKKPTAKDIFDQWKRLQQLFKELPTWLQPRILNAVAFLETSVKDEDKIAFGRKVEILRDCKESNFTAEEMSHIILLANMDMVHDMMWSHPQTEEIKELVKGRAKSTLQ